jgi:hypothetical protein
MAVDDEQFSVGRTLAVWAIYSTTESLTLFLGAVSPLPAH